MSLSLGAEPEGAREGSVSSTADTGGLVARGDGPAALNPKEAFCKGLLNPLKLDPPGVAGGVVADGVAGTGGAPLLNSAQRGHFRLVSAGPRQDSKSETTSEALHVLMCPICPQCPQRRCKRQGKHAARQLKDGSSPWYPVSGAD